MIETSETRQTGLTKSTAAKLAINSQHIINSQLIINFPAKEKDSTRFDYLPEYVLAMRNNYDVIKNLRLHKLATFNPIPLRYAFIVNPKSPANSLFP